MSYPANFINLAGLCLLVSTCYRKSLPLAKYSDHMVSIKAEGRKSKTVRLSTCHSAVVTEAKAGYTNGRANFEVAGVESSLINLLDQANSVNKPRDLVGVVEDIARAITGNNENVIEGLTAQGGSTEYKVLPLSDRPPTFANKCDRALLAASMLFVCSAVLLEVGGLILKRSPLSPKLQTTLIVTNVVLNIGTIIFSNAAMRERLEATSVFKSVE